MSRTRAGVFRRTREDVRRDLAPSRRGMGSQNRPTCKMNELRVYTNPSGAGETGGRAVFYSRRADGPYYCWLYEERAGRWQVDRVHLTGLNLRALRVTSWRDVPPELQAKISEHYLE